MHSCRNSKRIWKCVCDNQKKINKVQLGQVLVLLLEQRTPEVRTALDVCVGSLCVMNKVTWKNPKH